jgi:hypothetical protein
MWLDLTRAQNHRRLPVHGVPAAARSPYHRRPASRTLPNPVQPSEKIVHTSVKLPERGIGVCFAGETSPRSPDSTRPPCHWIKLGRRGLAGTPAANESTCLRTWIGRFRPPPPSSRTPLWPPGPPGANPAPRWTSLTAGKPRRPFLSCEYCLNLGRDRGGEEEKARGFCAMFVTRMNSSAGYNWES